MVVITIWVQREENRFYKAEFPIKVTNRETENQRKSPDKNWVRERERERERQTDRQTETETETETEMKYIT